MISGGFTLDRSMFFDIDFQTNFGTISSVEDLERWEQFEYKCSERPEHRSFQM